jgi:hypothetical protein
MSIDPSSIPNFGMPEPRPSGPPPIVRPDQALVTQLLDQMQIKHAVDTEGDLGASWDGFRIFFMFRGEAKELYAVRSFYERSYQLDKKGELLDVIDEWNRDTLWPKVYTHTHEDGVLRLIGESQMLVGGGVNLDYFAQTTVNWIQSAIGFNGWLAERLGLLADVDGESGDGDVSGNASGDDEADSTSEED